MVTSKPSDVGTRVRISAQSHELRFSLTSRPTSRERSCRGYTTFDFTVDEGKERLNPSRDQKLRQAPQKEGGKKPQKFFRVAFLLGDPDWSVHILTEWCNLTSRINEMTSTDRVRCSTAAVITVSWLYSVKECM